MEAQLTSTDRLAHVPEPIRAMIVRVKRDLSIHYGDRLQKLILYGSYARGDFHEESDIDLMAVLTDSDVPVRDEHQALFNITYPYFETYRLDISVLPVLLTKYEKADTFLLMFVHKDGIEL